MSDWKRNLKPGSFRGVPFKTKSHKFDSGRHGVSHEFPNKERGNSEDLGKILPTFTIDLYVIGDNYFAERDALIEALDAPGAGQLVHPYLGDKQVQVGRYTVQETVEEGRMARFSVDFTLAGSPEFPASVTDAFQLVLDTASNLLGVASAALDAAFSVANFPARVTGAAASLLSDAAGTLDRVVQLAGLPAQTVSDVAYAVSNLQADAEDLVKTPSLLASRYIAAFELLFTEVEDFKSLSLQISNEASSFSPVPVVGADTPTANKLRSNQLELTNFVLAVAVSAQARAAIQGNYQSVDEAVNIRELLNLDLRKLLDSVTDDETFQAVQDVLVAVNLGLPPQNLGEVVRFTPPEELPALVISQRLFGNIEKETEIIEQNKIAHPGFVPGLVALEVTSG